MVALMLAFACPVVATQSNPADNPGAEVVPDSGDTAAGDTGGSALDTGVADTGDSGGETAPVDADGDGWFAPDDCDDADPDVYPGAWDEFDDAEVDSDCNGVDGPFDASCWPLDAGAWRFADLNGDGKQDVLASGYDGGLHGWDAHTSADLTLGGAVALWSAPNVTLSFPPDAPAIFTPDVTGDGIADILAPVSPGAVIFDGATLASGGGSLSEDDGLWTVSADVREVQPDIDGDGVEDAITWGWAAYPATILSGSAVGEPRWSIDITNPMADYEFADLDADGLTDVWVQSYVFLGTSLAAGGTFAVTDADIELDFASDSHWAVRAVGDVDGDGLVDGACGAGSATGPSAALFSFAGVSRVSAADAFATLTSTGDEKGDLNPAYLSGVPDLDADGREEVAVGWFPRFGNGDKAETTLFAGEDLVGTMTHEDAFRRSYFGGYAYTAEDVIGDETPDLLMISSREVYIIDGRRVLP